MRAACGNDERASSCGWADDWTAALERPFQAARAEGAPRLAPSTSEALPPVPLPTASPGCDRPTSSDPNMKAAAPNASALLGPQPLPEPPRMQYCSAAERDEWAAVLGDREAAVPAQWPSPGPETTPAQGAAPTDLTGPSLHRIETASGAAAAEVSGAAAADALVTSRAGASAAPAGRNCWCWCEVTVAPASVAAADASPRGGGDDDDDGVVYVAIELGSHCSRAVLHDGRSELARLTYDTMLGQASSQAGGCSGVGGSAGGSLDPEALQRTVDALKRIMEAATAASTAARGAGAATGISERSAAAQARGPPARRVRVMSRMVATAAVRNAGAGSRAALAEAAEQLAGCRLEVLTGEDEGRLAWRGVVGGLQGLAPARRSDETAAAVGLTMAGAGRAPGGAGAPHGAAVEAVEAAVPSLETSPEQEQLLLVVDMGGRSTEFVHGHRRADRPAALSLPLGCVGLHSAACTPAAGGVGAGAGGGGDMAAAGSASPSLDALEACVRLSRETVERLCGGSPWLPPPRPAAAAASDTLPCPTTGHAVAPSTCDSPAVVHHGNSTENTSTSAGGGAFVIFTGGTVTTLAALHQRLPYYDRARVHGSMLTSYDISMLMASLAAAEGRVAALASYDWLTEARCRTLAAGCAGLLGVMAALGVEDVRVSDADLLDGLLAEMLDGHAA